MVSRPPQRARFLVRFELGLAAFAPAFGLLAFRSRSSTWSLVFLVFACAGAISLLVGLLIVVRGNPEPFTFGDIEDLSGDVIGHIAAYLVPVFIDTDGTTEEIIISMVVVALIVHIHIATGRVLLNPVLFLVGYRIYSAKSGTGSFYLIARSDVSTWTSARQCVRLGSSILVERHQ